MDLIFVGGESGRLSKPLSQHATHSAKQARMHIQSSFVLFYQSTISFLINAKLLAEWMETKRFE
jgi:hypothetical protein